MPEQLNVNDIPRFHRSSVGKIMIGKHVQALDCQYRCDRDYIKARKNGGTFAHPDISCEFNIWINPAFGLDVVKKFLAYDNSD
ncbi:hypothetical protein Dtox_1787 [Desulfofarcimen acetoxidans DSM 771]|jgi:hypothetical protein|uniref:KilA-N domain-containing protein n=1 Tax=Desulfofarcimen acetoxidans (strain ATCC 49208 / DSM 771 / KCTC 5769 / VKM B-1644 / 5575) TaxID=485916 RepID=C8VX64_DESAS|nr:KilA-N domain-containing protein [Desulfofarcimen acetoxidans]ACV62640.1 hypothetical protein Dtox_1787 [Desulfofarcimen acetoxidans DSM 771]